MTIRELVIEMKLLERRSTLYEQIILSFKFSN